MVRNVKLISRNLRDRTPRITAVVLDAEQRLSKSSIEVSVDGKNVSISSYSASTKKLQATSRQLKPGSHTLRIVVSDGTGKSTTKTTRFKVARQ